MNPCQVSDEDAPPCEAESVGTIQTNVILPDGTRFVPSLRVCRRHGDEVAAHQATPWQFVPDAGSFTEKDPL